jgi:hypothetical protein
MKTLAFATVSGALLITAIGCGSELRSDTGPSGLSSASATTTSDDGGTSDAPADGSTSDAPPPSTTADGGTTGGGPDSEGPKLDVGAAPTTGGPLGEGCDKVDFLFVIDASGSMDEEQANLAASFEPFIDAIVEQVGVEDVHILVTDTDPWADAGSISLCSPAPDCCLSGVCAESFQSMCNLGTGCWELLGGEQCDVTMGAGRRWSATGDDCGISGGHRWMTADQPDLPGTFECAARVGLRGSSSERAIEAMLDALSPTLNAGGCNDGFLRDDAILVATVITDEENQSAGTPDSWRASLTTYKNGDASAWRLIGFTPPGDEDFTELFGGAQATWADVATADYASVFLSAIDDIDTTCETFDPPG